MAAATDPLADMLDETTAAPAPAPAVSADADPFADMLDEAPAAPAAALQLACGISLKGRYLKTDRNPADEGSRKFGHRKLQKCTINFANS